ncbi:beta-mannosidase [Stackebrandtia albiflava]|uniref:beta-mannosidase n=1 Tax=Stackebrandtia albiflava TaxID=406432 RepID=A0A562V559_9ACTN|nr:glycoside hydrolase family 2 protein [Stackebrandtia albiflava]TWJ13013.1 beta-mannosidase [Stackebrandtia albiflava]
MVDSLPLHTGWTCHPVAGPARDRDIPASIPATVPGCVHTDLLAAGLIDDPYRDANEETQRWIGRSDWEYRCEFDWPGTTHEYAELACDGLDTVAELWLNGEPLGRTADMHRRHRFDVRRLLTPGRNRLVIRFTSAYTYAEAQRDRLGDLSNAYDEPFQFIRKMASSFGWDWGPTTVTAGIWRPIRIESWTGPRLAEVRPATTMDGDTGVARIVVTLAGDTGRPRTVTAELAGRRAAVEVGPGTTEATLELRLPGATPWFPHGHGEPHRYTLGVRCGDDSWRREIGFRTVDLDTTPDDTGRAFNLRINDRPIFVKGVNWIPDDALVTRVDADRYRRRLRQARDAGANLIRVWGGGLYESDEFYTAADELGLLVEQDFPFACAAYPEAAPFRDEVEAEARDNIARLAHHPSLVMWFGNNENIWGEQDWGWRAAHPGRPWGADYYFRLLPDLVARLDPSRPYWPGSPYSGDPAVHPNDPAHGSCHIWDVWNTHDYLHYRQWRPRFAAEFGYQAPATYATLTAALSDTPLAADSPGMRHHQKAVDGDVKLARGLAAHFGEPADFDDWHFLTQVNQARAIQVALGHFRSLHPECGGAIVWQLNDCWPVTSWSAVDAAGRLKPVYFTLRAGFADRLVTVQPRGTGLVAVLHNDTDETWRPRLCAARRDFTGRVVADDAEDVTVPPRTATTVPLPERVATTGCGRTELVTVDADTDRAWWFFDVDRRLDLPEAEYVAEVVDTVDGHDVTVAARTLLRDLCLFPDRLHPDATVDEGMVTLLPGESTRFRVRGATGLDAAALAAAPVLRCVNDRPLPRRVE